MQKHSRLDSASMLAPFTIDLIYHLVLVETEVKSKVIRKECNIENMCSQK